MSVETAETDLVGIRHILLHQLSPRYQVLIRPQIGPLYEDPPQAPFQGPNGRHPRLQRHPDWGTELDVQLHTKHLHPRGYQWFQLPLSSRTLQRQYFVGCRWTAALLWGGRSVSATGLGVSCWVRSSDYCMADRTQDFKWKCMEEDQSAGSVR